MPSLQKTLYAAIVVTGAAASLDHHLVQRDLIEPFRRDLISRDEAEDLLEHWTRNIDGEALLDTRDALEAELEDALVARSASDHLDDLYTRDVDLRDLAIRSDINLVFNDHDGLLTRSIEAEEAALRVRELEYRDPELFQLYRRGSKITGLLGGVGGAMLAGKGNRMAGFVGGGAAGFFGHKLFSHFKNKAKSEKRGTDDDSGGDQYRRDVDDPELFYY